MNHKFKLGLSITSLVLLVSLQSCKNQPTQPSQQAVAPVLGTLSASQIMAEEGITSVHYLLFDSAGGGSISDASFALLDEYCVDSLHDKIIQYNQGKSYAISAEDVTRNVEWSYDPVVQTVSYDSGLNMRLAVDDMIQACLGSSLRAPASYLRSEYIGEKFCDVYQDSTGYMEWIWREHRFPLQARNTTHLGIFTMRKQIIEINVVFPDSTYLPPRH